MLVLDPKLNVFKVIPIVFLWKKNLILIVCELNHQKIPVIGTDVGQLELECEFDKLLCAGKK